MLDGVAHIVQISLDIMKHEAEQRGKFVWFVKCKSPSLWPKQWRDHIPDLCVTES